ncbi:MAG: tRNA (N6-isopentenyl adenosine(37)-C2)-methylthiotransferase MiaB [Oscillospiraceae bacterium]
MYKEQLKDLIAEKYRIRTPLAYVRTFGCRQNESDSERIKGILKETGFDFTDNPENSDIIIYNTCAVRENAELKVFGILGEVKHIKEKNPDLIVVLCGCMTGQKHIVEKIKKTYKQVDIVFGTGALNEFPRLLCELLHEKRFVCDTNEYTDDFSCRTDVVRNSTYKADVPIMYGCNNFCTYCIVPYVRGRERSRPSAEILEEVRSLAEKGYKEIMLLGQNVNSYGKGLDENIDFPELLRKINGIDGDFRVRFMSSHPKNATRELIDAICECDKVCKHFHLPVQSGSDEILTAMNRNYTASDYLSIVEYAREKIPDFSFSTDIIVGFPNETEEDFQKTLDIMKKVKFDSVFSFIYSKRTGTKAALIDDKISDKEKSERMGRLLALQREISTEHYKRFIGRTLTVLAEEENTEKGLITGKSNEFIIVEFKADSSFLGQFVKVRITGAHNWALTGEII